MCQQIVLRFCISLRAPFSNLVVSTVINKYDKRAAVQISTVFWEVYHVAFPSVL